MALDDYIRSPLGLLNLFAVLLDIVVIFGCGLQWTNGVSLQIVFTDHVWLSAAQLLFIGSLLVMLVILVLFSFPQTDSQNRLSGGGLIFCLCIALLCELLGTIIIIYYVMVDDRNSSFYMRFVFVLIIAVLFIAVILIMMVLAHQYLNRVWAIEPAHVEAHRHQAVHHKVTVTPQHQNVHSTHN